MNTYYARGGPRKIRVVVVPTIAARTEQAFLARELARHQRYLEALRRGDRPAAKGLIRTGKALGLAIKTDGGGTGGRRA